MTVCFVLPCMVLIMNMLVGIILLRNQYYLYYLYYFTTITVICLNCGNEE